MSEKQLQIRALHTLQFSQCSIEERRQLRHRRPSRRRWCRNVPSGLQGCPTRWSSTAGASPSQRLWHCLHKHGSISDQGFQCGLLLGLFHVRIQQPLQLAACHYCSHLQAGIRLKAQYSAEFTATMFLFIYQEE